MGNAPIKKPQSLERRETQVGVLRVTIIGVQLNQDIKSYDGNLRLRVSNQHFSTTNLPPIGGVQNNAGDCFSFIINSFYKPYGRSIEIGYFKGQTNLCYGAFDVDILMEHRKLQEFRCILSDKNVEVGHVLVRGQFQPLPYQDITFRFETATIRRKTGSYLADNVAIRLTIGEEIFETECQKDTFQKPPVWDDKKYNFKVPQGVTRGLIELINDQGDTIAEGWLNFYQMMKAKQYEEVLQSQELFFTQNQNSTIAADLKYSYILGKNPNFLPRTEQFTSAIRGIRTKNEFQATSQKPHPI